MLTPAEQTAALTAAGAGAPIDISNRTIPVDFVRRLRDAAPRRAGRPVLRIDATGSRFEGDALFDGSDMEGSSFEHARFRGPTTFIAVRFGPRAAFARATFEEQVVFARSDFGPRASFAHARFGKSTSFRSATFADYSTFRDALFEGPALFERTTWGSHSSFISTVFCGPTSFSFAVFVRDAVFRSARFAGRLDMRGLTCAGGLVMRHARISDRSTFAHSTLAGASFNGASFGREVSFASAAFSGETAFVNTSWGDGALLAEAVFDGPTSFARSTFGQRAVLASVRLTRSAVFRSACFGAGAVLESAAFPNRACFDDAEFGDDCRLDRASFGDHATFADIVFGDAANLEGLTTGSNPSFLRGRFGANANLAKAVFGEAASFEGAEFGKKANLAQAEFGPDCNLAVKLGDLACLERVTFGVRCIVEVSAKGGVCLDGAELASHGKLSVRGTSLNARGLAITDSARLEVDAYRVNLSGNSFADPTAVSRLKGATKPPGIVSLERSDCSALVLSDVDLADCRFEGAHNLDKLQVEGPLRLKRLPRRGGRYAIAEELDTHSPGGPAPSLDAVHGIYRALRKGREDNKDAAAAAYFAYGESDSRRRALKKKWPGLTMQEHAELSVLMAYWALAGYGLRAWRPLLALGVVIALSAIAFQDWGLPQRKCTSKEAAAQTAQGGSERCRRQVSGSVAALHATQSTLGLVRAPRRRVTQAGEALALALRLVGPVLLAFVLLGIRSRVRR